MTRSPAAVALLGVLLVAAGCSRPAPPPSVEEAFASLKAAFAETDSNEEKARLAEEFLATYPDSEHSGALVDTLAYYLGEALGQKERAFTLGSEVLAKLTDPARRLEVTMALYPLAHELGRPLDLAGAADALAATRALSFSEHLDLVDLALAHDQWEMAERHAAAALPQATVEGYRADNPDQQLSEAELAAKGRERQERVLAGRGWAMANLGQLAEAESVLGEAAALATPNYLGVAASGVNTYLGRTVLEAGDAARALELLAADAVFGDRDDALTGLREAYALVNQGDAGFDEYLWSTRQRLARPLDAFTLPDYDGVRHEVTGGSGKVMLLAFWFPT